MIFKEEDCEDYTPYGFEHTERVRAISIEKATQIFTEWLESCPTVLGRMENDHPESTWWYSKEIEGEDPCTHEAKLVRIKYRPSYLDYLRMRDKQLKELEDFLKTANCIGKVTDMIQTKEFLEKKILELNAKIEEKINGS